MIACSFSLSIVYFDRISILSIPTSILRVLGAVSSLGIPSDLGLMRAFQLFPRKSRQHRQHPRRCERYECCSSCARVEGLCV